MMADLMIVENEDDHRKAMEIIDKLWTNKRGENRGLLRAQSMLPVTQDHQLLTVRKAAFLPSLKKGVSG